MNLENANLLLNYLRKLPAGIGFNMFYYYHKIDDKSKIIDYSGHNCGTVACIAGHAFYLMTGRPIVACEDVNKVVEWLDLSDEEAKNKFTASSSDKSRNLMNITYEQSILALERLIAGVDYWKIWEIKSES